MNTVVLAATTWNNIAWSFWIRL